MGKLTYAGLVWRNHRGMLLFSIAVVAALEYLIVWLISTFEFVPALAAAFDQLPPMIRTFFNEEFLTRLSARGAVAFGFDHPLLLSILAINAIVIPSRQISAEIESGTFELILAHPIKRTTVAAGIWISGAAMLLLIVAGALAGSFAAIALHHGLDGALAVRLLRIGANLFLLFVFVLSYTLLLSAFGKEGSRTGILGAGITVVFYFFHFLARLWDRIEPLRPLNMFTYYQPQELMFDQRSFVTNLVVLLAGNAVFLAIALWQLNRRDIPG
ncbi:MAG: ABC transporter permease subunit [Desulfobacterales bacterium]|nr:ABC transporter permease subunit [Desulfobacterales bacterium]